jgi:hypothetical protein
MGKTSHYQRNSTKRIDYFKVRVKCGYHIIQKTEKLAKMMFNLHKKTCNQCSQTEVSLTPLYTSQIWSNDQQRNLQEWDSHTQFGEIKN